MNNFLTATLNGIILSIPLTALVWIALALAGNRFNAATRYVVWWLTLAAVVMLPFTLVPHRRAAVRDLPTAVSTIEPEAVTRPTEIHSERVAAPAAEPVTSSKFTFDPGVWARRVVQVWEALAVLMLLRLCFSYVALQFNKRKAARPSAKQHSRFQNLLAQAGITRRIRLAILNTDASPMATGPFDPCVLIPERLIGSLNERDLDQVCLHEAGHLQRYDDFALMAQRVLESVACLHPAVRFIGRRLDFERELACDDFVVAQTDQPRSYASCLTNVAELISGFSGSRMASAIVDETSNLERRVEMLLDKTRNLSAKVMRWRAFAASIAMAIMVAMLSRTPSVLAFQAITVAPPPPPPPVVQAQVPLAPQPTIQATPTPQLAPVSIDVPVSVTDPLHRFVTGLDRDDFKLFEDGVPQRVTQFSGDDRKVSLSVVWDVHDLPVSQELVDARRRLEELRGAYKDTYPEIRDVQQKIALMERTAKTGEMDQAIAETLWETFAKEGLTLLRQPTLTGLKASAAQLAGSPRDGRAIVIVSHANTYPAGMSATIQSAGMPVFVVAVNPASTPDPEAALAAQTSGGQYLTSQTVSGVTSVVQRIMIELRNRYVLSYTPSKRATDNKFHHITVQVTPPRGVPELTVAHRVGYYGDSR